LGEKGLGDREPGGHYGCGSEIVWEKLSEGQTSLQHSINLGNYISNNLLICNYMSTYSH